MRLDLPANNSKIMSQLFQTNQSGAGLIARLAAAIVLFPHGAQKLMGWWDGLGFTKTLQFFTEVVHLPYLLGLAVILIEFICPLLLLIGYAVRASALAIIIVMIGIIVTVQNQYFFMNWFGNQKGEGMEFFLLMIGLCLVISFMGAGRFSLENYLKKNEES